MSKAKERTVFVTVGSTSFDDLVKAATEASFLKLLTTFTYKKVTLQIGRGQFIPSTATDLPELDIKWYRYKDSLVDDMKEADLIISHGGSGSILEALSFRKPLIVAVNQKLMNNHQTELARQLQTDGHLLYTSPRDLYTTLKKINTIELKTLELGQPQLFGDMLDELMGFSSKQ